MRARHGAPTAVQRSAWPAIAAGEHVLATAPTGSGKTLCAFLWALDRLLQGVWEPGTVRVLYVSPLKALNNDIRRNLLTPLSELRARLLANGATPPEIQVATRSGDTPAAERRRMARHPPEILITTPESLNLLLASASGRGMLGGVTTLILDEVHAIAGNRRGVWLAAGVERLVSFAGEVQRIALSATVRPLDGIAAWVGGYGKTTAGDLAEYPRPVRIVDSGERPRLELTIEALEPEPLPEDAGLDVLTPIARSIRDRSLQNRSTLVFCNSRQLAEKIAFRVNTEANADADATAHTMLAWAHHGSLARELRLEVEQRLKQGQLRAIVATSSLELGIDIGSLDEVVLVQAPPAVSSALQRIGRAGHGVGDISRAVLHPTHPHDLLEATVALHCALHGDIEPLRPLHGCLDVLAQVILATLLAAPAAPDELYDEIRRAAPYRNLPRSAFDAVVEMLSGRFATARIRELQPRITLDPDSGRLQARRGAALALYASGGMIPDRGYFQLRHAHTRTKIGELDEEFVWENGPGRAFSLGSQQWRVQRVTHNDVFVLPAPDATHAPPFWRAEERDRDAHLSARLAEVLERWELALAQGGTLLPSTTELAPLNPAAREMLADYLSRQRRHTGVALPHARHIVIERVRALAGSTGSPRTPDAAGQLVLHTMAGATVNRPWALALEAAWEERFGDRPEIHAGNDALIVQLEADVDPDTVLGMVDPENLERLLEQRLTGSGFFGARFRECAGRALLLPRRRFGERQPLWLSRLHAQRLLGRLQATPDGATNGGAASGRAAPGRAAPDFPIVVEAWRSCLEDSFELPALRARLTELAAGSIQVSVCDTASPSPFAAQLARAQINQYMYADDRPRQGGNTTRPTLLDAVLDDPAHRPRVAGSTVAAFMRRRRRLEPGWAPQDALELRDWLSERRFLPIAEFIEICASLPEAEITRAGTWIEEIACGNGSVVVLSEDAATLRRVFTADSEADLPAATRLAWISDWLATEPPGTADELRTAWPGSPNVLAQALAELEARGDMLRGTLLEDDERERLCLRSSFEAMLRQQRANRRHLQPLTEGDVCDFFLDWQRVGTARSLLEALEPLRGLPLAADCWERFVLPARVDDYRPDELDRILQAGELTLYGAGERQLAFALEEELAYLEPGEESANVTDDSLAAVPAGARLPFDYFVDATGDPQTAAERLWGDVWAGRLTVDTFEAVRRGLNWRFSLPRLASGDRSGERRPGRRLRLEQRVQARVRGYPGHFARLPVRRATSGDSLEALECARERARILLDRWGVVCPDLCRREARQLSWSMVFRALRWMELSGEVVGGWFLEGLSGPQFALPEALEAIHAWPGHTAPPRWLHAQDPASPCGLGLSLAGLPLPAARSGNELVIGGGRVLLTWCAGSGALAIDPPAGDAAFAETVATFAQALARRPARRQQLDVRTLNGEPGRESPCLAALEPHFRISADHRGLILHPALAEAS